ncbi:tetratricopeptide repeat-containing sensor histidine kinase [Costertonia aggregata]|uniref:histidine kinase n=1 Tax=Costertonia aggregata TaxID=343403 RepID=A0A7H9ARY9_9FLAO|nr:tetratricopeptide repeat protein [Costertonia aggregata]QLG46223.1 sensor histidine kinase [Costertonia aggregata]
MQELLDEAYGYENTNPQKALETYRQALDVSRDGNYNLGAFRSLNYSGIVYSNLAEYGSALHYYKESMGYADLADYPKGKAATLINIGNIHQYLGDFDKAVDNYLKGIEVFEIIKDSSSVAVTSQNLAALFSSLKKYDKEANYLNKALRFLPKKETKLLGFLYGDLGLSETRVGELKEAFEYFKKADSLSKLINDKRLDFFVERNFGEYYLLKKSFGKAIVYLENALCINEQLNDKYFRAEMLSKLGQGHAELKDYSKSVDYLNRAVEMASSNGLKEIQEKAYYTLSKVEVEKGNFKKALNYLNKHLIFKDSILNETYLNQINYYEKSFETKQKEAQISKQRLQLEKQQNTILKKENEKTLAYAIGGFLVLVFISLAMFFKQRQKAKANEILALKTKQELVKLEALIDGEENERNRLAQDLHDGINGDLAVIKYKISSIGQKGFSTKEKEDYGEALGMLDNAVEQVRRISHNLAPPSLTRFDLTEALEQFCNKQNTLKKVKISFQHFGNRVNLKKENETAIYRIVQELINNILKHAKASEAMVQINNHGDKLTITVEDNGEGFDPDNNSTGIGLQNIKSRVDFLKAGLDIDSSDNGTTIQIALDLNKMKEV